ncbi:MAG: PIN domain-containing protein [Leptospirales bacterium]
MDEMLKKALICYDANVLLNIYRYSEETQNGLIEVFQAFVDRTCLPHQVALEYARNRAKTIVDQANLCQSTEDAFKKVIKESIEPKDKQPFLSDESTEALNGIIDELATKRKALEFMISEDKYADLFLSLFDQKIGPAPDEEMLKQLHKQADDRYAKKTPPGYSDRKDKEGSHAYGDYIVWRQLMDIAKKDKRDFILVTDDSKDDWWLRLSGKTIGPRPELLEEFRRETGQCVWLFTSEGFLIATKEAGSTQVSDSVIKEVGEHLIAQTSALVSEDKLSSPNIDLEEANGSASDFKLSSQQVKHAKTDEFAKDASLQESKLMPPGKKNVTPTADSDGSRTPILIQAGQ